MEASTMKIDIFNHLFPKTFFDKMIEVAPNQKDIGRRVRSIPAVVDLEKRFQVMDQFEDYVQVICLPNPPLEILGSPEVTCELAQIANDGMAEYVAKYPDRFPGFIASLSLSNPDAALTELERAIKDLKAVGIQFFSNRSIYLNSSPCLQRWLILTCPSGFIRPEALIFRTILRRRNQNMKSGGPSAGLMKPAWPCRGLFLPAISTSIPT
jgi:hypothetical protein